MRQARVTQRQQQTVDIPLLTEVYTQGVTRYSDHLIGGGPPRTYFGGAVGRSFYETNRRLDCLEVMGHREFWTRFVFTHFIHFVKSFSNGAVVSFAEESPFHSDWGTFSSVCLHSQLFPFDKVGRGSDRSGE